MLPYVYIFGIQIPLYGVCLAAGFLLCGIWSFFRARKRGLPGENLIIIAAFVLGFAMIGGVLLYDLVTYSPAGIIALVKAGQWEALLHGGIVFYGALFAGAIGALTGSRVAKDDVRNYLDVVIPVVPLGHAIGRVGCFCAGCCYGCPTESPLGVTYTHAIGGAPAGVSLLPVQLIEAAADIVIFAILMPVSARTGSRYLTTYLYCIMYGIVRFVLEFYRYDSIRGMAGGLSTSQWISLVMIIISVILLIVFSRRKIGMKTKE